MLWLQKAKRNEIILFLFPNALQFSTLFPLRSLVIATNQERLVSV